MNFGSFLFTDLLKLRIFKTVILIEHHFSVFTKYDSLKINNLKTGLKTKHTNFYENGFDLEFS